MDLMQFGLLLLTEHVFQLVEIEVDLSSDKLGLLLVCQLHTGLILVVIEISVMFQLLI